jgi:hypothetical protein
MFLISVSISWLLTCTTAYSIEELTSESAIYEKLGILKTMDSTWTILTYTNMNDLDNDATAIQNYIRRFNKTCNPTHWTDIDLHCDTNLEILLMKPNDIRKMNVFLKESLRISKRKKTSFSQRVRRIGEIYYGYPYRK